MKMRLYVAISLVLAFLVALTLITVALAYTVPDSTIVYITPTGTKYHREDCSYTTTVRSMTIKEAERRGFEPCSRCDPDRVTGEYISTWDDKSSSSGNSGGKPSTTHTPSPEPSTSTTPSKNDTPIGLTILKVIGSVTGAILLWFVAWWLLFLVTTVIKKLLKRK